MDLNKKYENKVDAIDKLINSYNTEELEAYIGVLLRLNIETQQKIDELSDQIEKMKNDN